MSCIDPAVPLHVLEDDSHPAHYHVLPATAGPIRRQEKMISALRQALFALHIPLSVILSQMMDRRCCKAAMPAAIGRLRSIQGNGIISVTPARNT